MKAKIAGAGLLLLTPSVHALINLGPGQLDLLASAAIAYDSNLTGGKTGKSDTFVTLSPELEFGRAAGLIQMDAGLGVHFIRYFDQTTFNADDLNGRLKLTLAEMAGSSFKGSLQIAYEEGASVQAELNTRVHSNTLTAGANGQLQINRRLLLTGGTTYSNVERSGNSNQETIGTDWRLSFSDFLRDTSARASYSYLFTRSEAGRYSPVALSQTSQQISAGLSRPLFRSGETNVYADFGYRFLDVSAAEKRAGNRSGSGYTIGAGIDGPFLPARSFPKLHSKFGISYSDSATPGLNDSGQRALQGNIGLDWEARPNTTVGVSAAKTRTLAINNLTVDSTSLGFHGTQKLRYNLNANANVAYSWSTYPAVTNPALVAAGTGFTSTDRDDKTFSAGASLAYTFARVWHADLSYDYRKIDSSSGLSSYDHHLVSLGVGCRY